MRQIRAVCGWGLLGAMLCAGLPGCGRTPVAAQAMAAYRAGDYAKALPLLKRWAEDPAVRVDGKPPAQIMRYIQDTEQKLHATHAAKQPAGPAQPTPVKGTALQQSARAAATAPFSPIFTPTAAAPGTAIPMGADRIPHTRPKPGELLTCSIKAIGNFNFDPRKDAKIPPDVNLLDGAHVRLRGFMIPITQADDIIVFAQGPSLMNCCFGLPLGVQHVITCHTPKGQSVQYTIDEISVEGVLHVHVVRENGYTSSIFELTVENESELGDSQ